MSDTCPKTPCCRRKSMACPSCFLWLALSGRAEAWDCRVPEYASSSPSTGRPPPSFPSLRPRARSYEGGFLDGTRSMEVAGGDLDLRPVEDDAAAIVGRLLRGRLVGDGARLGFVAWIGRRGMGLVAAARA